MLCAGITVPVENGGLGLGYSQHCIAMEVFCVCKFKPSGSSCFPITCKLQAITTVSRN